MKFIVKIPACLSHDLFLKLLLRNTIFLKSYSCTNRSHHLTHCEFVSCYVWLSLTLQALERDKNKTRPAFLQMSKNVQRTKITINKINDLPNPRRRRISLKWITKHLIVLNRNLLEQFKNKRRALPRDQTTHRNTTRDARNEHSIAGVV